MSPKHPVTLALDCTAAEYVPKILKRGASRAAKEIDDFQPDRRIRDYSSRIEY
jgi:hypothetical protein